MNAEKTASVADMQKVILEIFIEVKKILEKHNIRYFAIGGTCIGAVRHKGFIPWDDDLDIAIAGDDYKKFLEIAPLELPEHLQLRTPNDSKHSLIFFSKVHNVNTTFVEKSDEGYPDCYKGLFIDIMPLYGVPFPSKRYQTVIKLLRKINIACRRPIGTRNLLKEIPFLPFRIFNRLYGNDFWYNKWFNFMSKYSFDTAEYVGYTWSKPSERLTFPKAWFEDYVDMPFESTTIRCPAKWHEYLSKQFGDYMKLPPEDKQCSNHFATLVDLENPYTLYLDK